MRWSWLLLLLLVPMIAAQPTPPGALIPLDTSDEVEKEVRHERDWSFHITLGAVGLTGVVLLMGWLTRWPPVMALFSRLRRQDVLEAPHRQRLLEIIGQVPGIGFAQLQAETGLARGTLDHHVRRLETEGAIAALRLRGQTAFFLPGQRMLAEARTSVRSKGAKRLLAAIDAMPGAHTTALAAAANLSASTTHKHLDRMEAAGVVRRERSGRHVTAWLTDLGAAMAIDDDGAPHATSAGLKAGA